jgi:molybdopterin/thiamine biosynthesis adenylyltransferase
MADDSPLNLSEDRFARFRQIQWWDQGKLANARVLLIGAGAIGNEVIKNLALLGVGHVAIADMDRIEQSNLSRSVLFNASDDGKHKATVAAGCQHPGGIGAGLVSLGRCGRRRAGQPRGADLRQQGLRATRQDLD